MDRFYEDANSLFVRAYDARYRVEANPPFSGQTASPASLRLVRLPSLDVVCCRANRPECDVLASTVLELAPAGYRASFRSAPVAVARAIDYEPQSLSVEIL